jgi:regulator of cell morphogenesis and NO signaling
MPLHPAHRSDRPADRFAGRTLAEIAATLPGATAVFRTYKLDFCCGGGTTLAAAASEKRLPLERVAADLAALDAGAAQEVEAEPGALIDHILSRYHEVHRHELPELLRLARRVEAVHAGHPQLPAGLAGLLEEIAEELTGHMLKEEEVLFPLMRRGGHPMIAHPIAAMRSEHVGHGERLRALEELTHGGVPPEDACATWRALYAGTRKLVDDVIQHIHLENNVLFPQFAAHD